VTIMLERICDIVAIIVLFAANLLWFPVPQGREAQLASVRTAGVILLALCAVGMLILVLFERNSKGIIGWFDTRLKRWRFIPERLSHALIHLLEQLAGALKILADARELTATVLWTVVIWVVNTVSNLLVILAFGLQFSLTNNIFVMGWSLVGSLVPTPGGAAGAFHAATAAGLIFLNRPDLDANKAAAIAIMLHLVAFAPAVVWGLYYFLRGDVSFKRLQQLSSSEEIEHSIEEDEVENEKGDMSNELKAVRGELKMQN
ncbi:MAG: lysylphosphatidylglycerol synthase domain-containing protein, partial [Acidobacteriota bacterium]|nr:lysylphosphatidylglycerol synthase domain-containing protein [Acidobacteriota bacterium]